MRPGLHAVSEGDTARRQACTHSVAGGSPSTVGPPQGMPEAAAQHQQAQQQCAAAAAQAPRAQLFPRTGDVHPEPASPPPPARSNQTQRPGAVKASGSCGAQHSVNGQQQLPREAACVDALVKAAESAFASSAMAERHAAAIKAAKIRQAEVTLGFVKRRLVAPPEAAAATAVVGLPPEPSDPVPDDGGLGGDLTLVADAGQCGADALADDVLACPGEAVSLDTCEPQHPMDPALTCTADDGALLHGPWHADDWRADDCHCGWATCPLPTFQQRRRAHVSMSKPAPCLWHAAAGGLGDCTSRNMLSALQVGSPARVLHHGGGPRGAGGHERGGAAGSAADVFRRC